MKEYEYLKKYCKMAGLTFIGRNMKDFLIKYNYLKYSKNKEEFINELMSKEPTVHRLASMEMKVNGLLKIIDFGYEKEALAMVIRSNYIKKNSPEVIEMAEHTLNEIVTNKIVIKNIY